MEPSAILSELDALYGSHALPSAGIAHTVHAARARDGRLHALRIDAAAPKSPTDWFVLNLCRARADAILTSAENLRREPHLVHRASGPWADALAAFRARVLGKTTPPLCAILTRRGDLPLAHPVWSDGTPKLVLTEPSVTAALRARLGGRAEVVGLAALDAVRACDALHARGAPLVSVEAGPSTAAALYAAGRVTELWLTEWESASAAVNLAGALPDDAALLRGLSHVGGSRRTEAGETFRFDWWRAI